MGLWIVAGWIVKILMTVNHQLNPLHLEVAPLALDCPHQAVGFEGAQPHTHTALSLSSDCCHCEGGVNKGRLMNEIQFYTSLNKVRYRSSQLQWHCLVGPELTFAKCDNHYPSRSGQTSLATALTNFTKPVTRIYSGPSTLIIAWIIGLQWLFEPRYLKFTLSSFQTQIANPHMNCFCLQWKSQIFQMYWYRCACIQWLPRNWAKVSLTFGS